MQTGLFPIVLCLFFAIALSRTVPSELRPSTSCYTIFGNAEKAGALETVHISTTSKITVSVQTLLAQTPQAKNPALATRTVIRTVVSTFFHLERAEASTATLFRTKTKTKTLPTQTITDVADAITLTYGTNVFEEDAVMIATSPGFSPLESTLPRGHLLKREVSPLVERAQSPAQNLTPAFVVAPGAPLTKIPQSVVCNTVAFSTVTVSNIHTPAAKKLQKRQKRARTSTVYLTVTHVVNKYKFPPARTTTVTQHVAVEVTTTPLTTTTTTPTVSVSSTFVEATEYAACGANNLANQIDNYPINGFALAMASVTEDTSNLVSYSSHVISSAYDCCVLAQQTADSTVFFYTGKDFANPNTCMVFVSDDCPIPAGQAQVYGAIYNGTASMLGSSFGNYVGNGNCGVGYSAAANYSIITQAQGFAFEGGGTSANAGAGTNVTG